MAIANIIDRLNQMTEENKQLRIDNTDNLCEECSQLAKQAGITEEDTSRILKDYRDKVENSIPISVIQNKINEIIHDKNYKYYDMFLETRDIEKTISILQELLEERE